MTLASYSGVASSMFFVAWASIPACLYIGAHTLQHSLNAPQWFSSRSGSPERPSFIFFTPGFGSTFELKPPVSAVVGCT